MITPAGAIAPSSSADWPRACAANYNRFYAAKPVFEAGVRGLPSQLHRLRKK